MLAEELGHYYKTSRTSPDSWLMRIEELIEQHGGRVLGHGYGRNGADSREAYVFQFELDGERYKIVWPVLPTEKSKVAARIQATTLMYHDVKQKIVSSQVLGNRAAFFQYLMLPNGYTASEIADQDLLAAWGGLRRPLLTEIPDAVIDGECCDA